MVDKTLQTLLEEYYEYEGVILYDDMDEAFLGIGQQYYNKPIAIYDRQKCIEILAADMGYEEAEEFFEFNIIGGWLGDQTPIFLSRLEE